MWYSTFACCAVNVLKASVTFGNWPVLSIYILKRAIFCGWNLHVTYGFGRQWQCPSERHSQCMWTGHFPRALHVDTVEQACKIWSENDILVIHCPDKTIFPLGLQSSISKNVKLYMCIYILWEKQHFTLYTPALISRCENLFFVLIFIVIGTNTKFLLFLFKKTCKFSMMFKHWIFYPSLYNSIYNFPTEWTGIIIAINYIPCDKLYSFYLFSFHFWNMFRCRFKQVTIRTELGMKC